MTDSLSHAAPQSESSTHGDIDALLSRLQVIEDQPFGQRAPAFVQLHDELRSALEGADTSA